MAATAAARATAHVYDWAKARGYWLRAGDPAAPTHLRLDGGRLRVPDEAAAAFLNAYAASLARCPSRPPCVVELRTPVFRMHLDIDSRFASHEDAAAAADGSPAALAAFARIADAVQPGTRAMVCVANRPKRDEDGGDHKLGFHVVFPTVFVTSSTALRVRRFVVARLAGVDLPGMAVSWDKAIDATVLRSNGLRMPWSAKGATDTRFYELRFVLQPDGRVDRVAPSSVSTVREALHSLTIRTPGRDPTVAFDDDDADAADAAERGGAPIASRPLAAYADVLADVADALPVQFAGQRFTGIMVSDHCVMIRSTSRYCLNLGRAHRTNNVYFLLTARGVCQRCYCRCETAEGRKYGMCKDFSSEAWPVPARVVDAFFGDAKKAATASGGGGTGGGPGGGTRRGSAGGAPARVSAMPSRAAKLDIDSLMARARPAAAAVATAKARGAAVAGAKRPRARS